MPTYARAAKPTAILLLILTVLLAVVCVIAYGFFALMINLIMRPMIDDPAVREAHRFGLATTWVLATMAAVVLPVIPLTRFYYVVAAKFPSRRYAVAGWIASAVYHGTLTFFLGVYSPGSTVKTGGVTVSTVLLTGAAAVVSIYLASVYPRVPKLPVDQPA